MSLTVRTTTADSDTTTTTTNVTLTNMIAALRLVYVNGGNVTMNIVSHSGPLLDYNVGRLPDRVYAEMKCDHINTHRVLGSAGDVVAVACQHCLARILREHGH